MKIEFAHQNPDNPDFIRGTLAIAIPDKSYLKSYVEFASTEVMMRVGLALCSEKQYFKPLGREVSTTNMTFQDVKLVRVSFPEEGKTICHFKTVKEKAGRSFEVHFALSFVRKTDHVRLEYGYIN